MLPVAKALQVPFWNPAEFNLGRVLCRIQWLSDLTTVVDIARSLRAAFSTVRVIQHPGLACHSLFSPFSAAMSGKRKTKRSRT